jgi:protease IV
MSRYRLPWRIMIACLIAGFWPAWASAAPATKPAAKPVIAVFQLNGELTEQPADDSMPLFGTPGPSLRDVVERMGKAAHDADVKAVVILADDASFGVAQIEELRAAIQKVRAAGKKVYAQSDSMMMGEYLLLSGVSRLSVVTTGDVWVTGLYGDAPYLHGLLTKIGVQADFLHCGAYKSAAEIFMRDGPSPEAEQMQNWLLDSIYGTAIKLIAAGRNVTEDQARAWIDGGPYTAEKAKAAGMIDAIENREQLEAALKAEYPDAVFEKRYGSTKPPQLDMSNPFALMRTFAQLMGAAKPSEPGKPSIGIVYVVGAILPGQSDPGLSAPTGAYSTDISRALDEAARDDSIKAVVLRIDSPGGSAVASEIILQATQRVKDKKPLVVSMGDVAGSGGYYVACAADTIFADQGSITGSIGVVGGKFITTEMWNHIGVTWKSYQRGNDAALLSTDAPFTPEQRQHVQSWMDDIYGVFKGHVTAIRGNRLKKPIDDLAGGRVYTGEQGLDLGLVDKIGTLSDAIVFAADLAKITDYEARTVPAPKNFLQRLMEQSTGGEDDPNHLAVGNPAGQGVDGLVKLAAPYLANLDPYRVGQIEAALRQLQLVQKEGVILMMPAQFCAPASQGGGGR